MVELTDGGRLVAVAPNPSIDRLVEVGELRRGDVHRPLAVTVVPGGKGLNVARVAATLGASVTAIGLLGGHAGRWIAETLGAEGVAVRAAWRQAETRTCTSVFDRNDGRTTEFYESGAPLEGNEWQLLLAEIDSVLSAGDVGLLSVSGSLPPGAPGNGLAQIVERARSTRQPVVIDGHGAALTMALRARPWLVKVNLAEARAVLDPTSQTVRSDPPSSIAAAAAAVSGLRNAGAERAIVTLGTLGAVAALEDDTLIHVRPGRPGLYPVGSGDAFLAGVAVSLLGGGDMRDAVVRGTAAAAASSRVPGAGRLERANAEALISEVIVAVLR